MTFDADQPQQLRDRSPESTDGRLTSSREICVAELPDTGKNAPHSASAEVLQRFAQTISRRPRVDNPEDRDRLPGPPMKQVCSRLQFSCSKLQLPGLPFESKNLQKISVSATATPGSESNVSVKGQSRSLKQSPLVAGALAQADKWIVFSDLHVHQKFEPYWQNALAEVHALATAKRAGVLFLVCSYISCTDM
jgi:hypothetical protein